MNLVLSEVVTKEVTNHIAVEAEETQRELKTALKRHERRWRLGKDLEAVNVEFQIGDDATNIAEEQVARYVEAIGAEIIPGHGDGSLSEEILRRYFGLIVPFEKRETKKHEFPDAFALLSLEQVAASRKTLIVCVSPDKGWADFALRSDHLVVVPELDELLSWFNDPDSYLANKVLAVWLKGHAEQLDTEVDRAFEYYLDGLDFEVEGDAPLSFEVEPYSAVMQYIDKDTVSAPAVVAQDADQVTLTLKVTAKIGFEASFSFYVHDSIDGDTVTIASELPYREKDIVFELSLTVAREMDGDVIDVIDVTVTFPKLQVDFGYVDPFPDEDPKFEKY